MYKEISNNIYICKTKFKLKFLDMSLPLGLSSIYIIDYPNHTKSTLMKIKLHFLTTLLIFSSSFMNLTYAQLKKNYYINAASQLTTGSYNGCGSHYTNWNDEYFGFSWTDNLARAPL